MSTRVSQLENLSGIQTLTCFEVHKDVKDIFCYPERSCSSFLSVTCLQKINLTRKNILISWLSYIFSKTPVLQFRGLAWNEKNSFKSLLALKKLYNGGNVTAWEQYQTGGVQRAEHQKGSARRSRLLLLRFRGSGLCSSWRLNSFTIGLHQIYDILFWTLFLCSR